MSVVGRDSAVGISAFLQHAVQRQRLAMNAHRERRVGARQLFECDLQLRMELMQALQVLGQPLPGDAGAMSASELVDAAARAWRWWLSRQL